MKILNTCQGIRAAAIEWQAIVRKVSGALVALFLSSTPAMAANYSIGVAPQFESRRMFSIWQPIIGELEKRTGHQFRLAVPLTVTDFERELEKGSYDSFMPIPTTSCG